MWHSGGLGYLGPAHKALSEAVGSFVVHTPNWNNAPERTHAEVMQAFDRAISLAERVT